MKLNQGQLVLIFKCRPFYEIKNNNKTERTLVVIVLSRFFRSHNPKAEAQRSYAACVELL